MSSTLTLGIVASMVKSMRPPPIPVLYSSSDGHSFGSPVTLSRPFGVVEGDTLLFICTIRNQAGEAAPSYITSVPSDWELISDTSYAPEPPGGGYTWNRLYVYRKTATASEPATYEVHRDGPNGPGFMNASAQCIHGAGAINTIVNASPPAPYYVPAVTTDVPNCLLICAYTAKDPIGEFMPQPPTEPVWEGAGDAYYGGHWNAYQTNAPTPGVYGPTSSRPTGTRDQYTVLVIEPIPVLPGDYLTITKLTPASGSVAGGTLVTMTGTSFAFGLTVTVGGVPVPSGNVTVIDSNTLTFLTPAAPTGVQSVEAVIVELEGAATSEPIAYTYNLVGGFSPAQVPGLIYWLNSEVEAHVSLSGSNVTEWRDMSLNRYVFAAGSSPTYTETINGKKVMTFTSDWFRSSQEEPGDQPVTFSWVMDPTPGEGALWSHQFDTAQLINITTDNKLILVSGYTAETNVSTIGMHVWTVVFDRSRSKVYRDGILEWTGDPGYVMHNGPPTLFNGAHDNPRFSGYVPEFLSYRGLLSDANRVLLEDYLTTRWAGGPYAPYAPTLTTATAGNGQVALAWTPGSTGGSPITDYIIEKSANGTSGWTTVTESVSTTPSYTVTGLTNGTIQYFRVSAVNAIGTGPPSNVMSATPFTVPGAPTGLGATPASTTVALVWTAPASNGGAAITDYVVQWRTTAGPGAWTTFSHAASTATAITVTGLTNGTGYDFQVAAVNPAGPGSYSTTASATPTVAYPAIAAQNSEQGTSMGAQAINMPTGIVAGNLLLAFIASDLAGAAGTHAPSTGWTEIRTQLQGTNVVRLSAFGRIADGTATDNLTVTGPSQDYCAWTGRITGHTVAAISEIPVADAVAATGAANPPNLNPGVARAWRWFAAEALDLTTGNTITSVPSGYTEAYRNVSASSTSSVGMGVGHKTGDTTSEDPGTFTNSLTTRPWVAFTIGIPNLALVPSAPTLTTATPGNAEVALVWTAPTSLNGAAITNYTIEYRTSPSGTWTAFSHAPSTALAIIVTGLTNATAYDFRVSAVNSAGVGAVSNTMTATPAAPGAGLYFTDDFNRANGSLGPNWEYINPSGWPSCAIVSNKLDFNNGNLAAVWATPCATQDQFVEVDITVGASEAGALTLCGVMGDDTPASGYILNIYQWDSRPQIYKDGVNVYYFPAVLSGAGTYRVTFTKVGNTFSCLVNGVSAGTPWVDTGVLLVGNRVGVVSENALFDNIVGGDYPPPSPSALVLHYDYSDASSFTMDGSNIAAIAAQSGLGPSLTDPYDGVVVTTSNGAPSGRASATFVGGNGMTGVLASSWTSPEITFMATCARDPAGEWTRLVSLADEGNDWEDLNGIVVGRSEGKFPSAEKHGDPRRFAVIDQDYYTTWHLFTFLINGSTVVIRVDGVQVTSVAFNSAPMDAPRFGIGGQASGTQGGDSYRGRMGEVKAWNHVLDSTSLAEQEALMMGRWITPSAPDLTLLQHAGTGNWSDDANFVRAYPNNLTAGSLLVVSCECRTAATPTITDSGGHTWTLQASNGPYPNAGFMSAQHFIWTAPNSGAAACTVTIDWTGIEGNFGCVMVTEVSNAVLADVVLAFGNTAAVSVGPTVTASAAGMGLLFVHACEEMTLAAGSPTPADIDQDWSYPMNGYLLAHGAVAAAATFTGTCTVDPTARIWAAAAVLLQPSS